MEHNFNVGKSQTQPRSSMFCTAIVTDNADPDNLGRIKVQYPWSRDNESSFWARVSTLMAGEEQGFYFIPEIDQEVLVAFVNGDVQYPIIIGTLWSQQASPPEQNDNGNNDIKKIRSRSGHEIVFDDSEESKLEISTISGHRILLDDSSGNETISIEDNGGGLIKLDAASNEILIKSNMDVSIEATNIKINASGELTLKGALIKIN